MSKVGNINTFRCADCDKVDVAFLPGVPTSNYAVWDQPDNPKTCKPCTSKRVMAMMDQLQPVLLYFTEENPGNPNRATITDACNTVRFPCVYSVGRHNWYGVKRYDIWFRDHAGRPWYGVCMSGGMNQAFKARPIRDTPQFPLVKRSV